MTLNSRILTRHAIEITLTRQETGKNSIFDNVIFTQKGIACREDSGAFIVIEIKHHRGYTAGSNHGVQTKERQY